jgi:hypothetical protein
MNGLLFHSLRLDVNVLSNIERCRSLLIKILLVKYQFLFVLFRSTNLDLKPVLTSERILSLLLQALFALGQSLVPGERYVSYN